MLTALYTILFFCLIIAIHEFGHFFTAKLTGITVHEFSIGMGPKVFGGFRGGTQYSLRLLPIGGFVRMEGEDSESDDPNAFGNKNPWQRLIVLAAGAFMNFVLGLVLFVIIFAQSKGFYSATVGSIIDGSAFQKAGMLPGDRIVYMQSDAYKSAVHNYDDISYFIYKSGDKKADITFVRDGEKYVKSIKPAYIESQKAVLFGFKPKVVSANAARVIEYSLRKSFFVVKLVVSSFADLVKGTVHMSDMSGPVGIVREIGSATKVGFTAVLSLAALISINLGVVNLLPLPALDGGRILFILFEIVRGKPIDKEKEGFIHFAGLVLLLLLMAVITYADIVKLL